MGLLLTRQFLQSTQVALRGVMGVFTVFIGLRMTYLSLNGNGFQIIKQVVIMILALTVGRILGRLLRIQRTLNRLGHYAGERFAQAKPEDPNRTNEGFAICTL